MPARNTFPGKGPRIPALCEDPIRLNYLRSLVDRLAARMTHRDRYPKIEVGLINAPVSDGQSFPGGLPGLHDRPARRARRGDGGRSRRPRARAPRSWPSVRLCAEEQARGDEPTPIRRDRDLVRPILHPAGGLARTALKPVPARARDRGRLRGGDLDVPGGHTIPAPWSASSSGCTSERTISPTTRSSRSAAPIRSLARPPRPRPRAVSPSSSAGGRATTCSSSPRISAVPDPRTKEAGPG